MLDQTGILFWVIQYIFMFYSFSMKQPYLYRVSKNKKKRKVFRPRLLFPKFDLFQDVSTSKYRF